jgi:hypothetical protein
METLNAIVKSLSKMNGHCHRGESKMITNAANKPVLHSIFMPGYPLDGMLRQDVDTLISDMNAIATPTVREGHLQGLPAPVRRYLKATNIVGKPRTVFARARWLGEFRRGPDQKWMPLVCEQYNRIDKPARLWYAAMKFMPFVNFYVRDAYHNGEGTMYARLTPWYKMFDERGPEYAQGELLVALNDMVFFPSAFLSESVRWAALDDRSARATLTTPNTTVSGVFYFNEHNDVVDFEAERYRTVGKASVMTKWTTPFRDHREVNGVRIPTSGEAVWHLAEGSYSYVRVSLVDIQYNAFCRYP